MPQALKDTLSIENTAQDHEHTTVLIRCCSFVGDVSLETYVFFVKGKVIDFTIETCTSRDNLMRGSLLPKKATILNGNDSKFEAALGFLKRPIFTVYGCT